MSSDDDEVYGTISTLSSVFAELKYNAGAPEEDLKDFSSEPRTSRRPGKGINT